jgi:hypothetical protein
VSAQFTVLSNCSFNNLAVVRVYFHFLIVCISNRHTSCIFSISHVRKCAQKTALTVAETKHHIEDFSAGLNRSEHKLAVCPQCGSNAFDGRLCAVGIGIRLNCVEKQQACAAALVLTQG